VLALVAPLGVGTWWIIKKLRHKKGSKVVQPSHKEKPKKAGKRIGLATALDQANLQRRQSAPVTRKEVKQHTVESPSVITRAHTLPVSFDNALL
jgi:hypothetical protein